MKIKDLIEKLKKYDENDEVLILKDTSECRFLYTAYSDLEVSKNLPDYADELDTAIEDKDYNYIDYEDFKTPHVLIF